MFVFQFYYRLYFRFVINQIFSRNEVNDAPSPSHWLNLLLLLFFQACIGGYWASSPVCTCPLCKHQFDERPQLSINKVFALITDNYKLSYYGAAGLSVPVSNGTPALVGAMVTGTDRGSSNQLVTASMEVVVWCDVCTGVKQPAVYSCLTCTAAYCTEHVQPHRTVPFYAKHPLMDPQEALRGRTCSIHRRLLEVRPLTPGSLLKRNTVNNF